MKLIKELQMDLQQYSQKILEESHLDLFEQAEIELVQQS